MRHIRTEKSADKDVRPAENARRTITKTDERNAKNRPDKSDESLRPSDFSHYIGQKKAKEQVLTAVKSAMIRNTAVPHILLYGPPGLGKTTMAKLVASETGTRLVEVTGPSIEKPGDIASILFTLKDRDILFIDEIHRMDKKAEEMLYSAMEDKKLHITVGQSEQAKVVTLNLPDFTLIGATTRAGMLSAPLRDRFTLICKMEFYEKDELAEIGKNTADKAGIELSDECLELIAEASRGTPRLMNNNVCTVRDYCVVHNDGVADTESVRKALSLSGINSNGLRDTDMKILDQLYVADKPVGLMTLAHILGEDEGTIESAVEPYLLRKHLIEKTGRGRVITDEGKAIVLGKELKTD